MKKSLLTLSLTGLILITGCNTEDPQVKGLEKKIDNLDQKISLLHQEIELLEEKNIKLLEEQINDNKVKIEEVSKIALRPVNTDIEDAINGAIKLSQLTNPKIRQNSCQIMGKLSNEKTTIRLLEIARTDEDPSVRNSAITALVESKYPKAGEVCLELIQSSNNSVRNTAAHLLKNIITAPMADTVLDATSSIISSSDYTDKFTRRLLFDALSKVVTPENFDKMHKLYINETNMDAKKHALTALINCSEGNFSKIAAIISGNTSHTGLDSQSILSLIPIADKRVTPGILPLFEYNNYETNLAIIRLMEKLKDPLAAEKLVEFYHKRKQSNAGQILKKIISAGYPGIIYDSTNDKATLVQEDVLQQLITKRNQEVAKLQ